MPLAFHELAEIFPLLDGEAYEAFKRDIAENGLREPIWLHEGKIIDGRNRYRACQELGIELSTRDWTGPGSPLAFVLSENLYRRHLDESQRALVGARAKPFFEAEARERQKGGQGGSLLGANLPEAKGRARDKVADLMNVSPRSIEHASTVLVSGVQELEQMVKAGEVAVSAAATVAHLPRPEQQQLAGQGAEAVTARAKEMREEARKGPALLNAREEAERDPERRWCKLTHDLYKMMNSIHDIGGMEKLTKNWSEEGKRSEGKELKLIRERITEWIAFLLGENDERS